MGNFPCTAILNYALYKLFIEIDLINCVVGNHWFREIVLLSDPVGKTLKGRKDKVKRCRLEAVKYS